MTEWFKDQESLKLIADWLVAFGTLALAVVTVFQDKIRTWVVRPKLLLEGSAHTKTPFRVQESISEKKEANVVTAYLVDLLVKNEGSSQAQDAEVIISTVLHKEADGIYREIKSFPCRNLVWRGADEIFSKAISPGMKRPCKFFAIVNPSERLKAYYWDNPALDIAADETTLGFDLQSKPFSRTHVLGPGEYRVKLFLAAANMKPKEVTIEISHTGQWFDDEEKMASKGVGVRIV